MRVKVCGITRLEDASLAAELGAAAVGFVFWPRSPRFIDPYRARDIVRMLPPFVTPVGVFVDQPVEDVQGIAALVRLGAVQLHGSETPELAARLQYRVIKAVAVSEGFAAEALDDWPPAVLPLLDAHDPEKRGGTGRTIDWLRAAEAARRRSVVLSGGLTAGNVREAVASVRPYAVDVSSGVEARPGVKDHARMREFFAVLGEATGVFERERP